MNASGKKSQKSSPVHMNHCFFSKKKTPPALPNEEEKELKHPSFVLLVSFAVASKHESEKKSNRRYTKQAHLF